MKNDDILEQLKWLTSISDLYMQSMTSLERSSTNLRTRTENSFTHFHVRKENFDQLLKHSLAEGIIDLETEQLKTLPSDFTWTKSLWIEYLNDQGTNLRLLKLFRATREMSVTSLLEEGLRLLGQGNVLIAFLSFRSLIEHIAHSSQTVQTLSEFCPSKDLNTLREQNSKLNELLVQSVFGRRINWNRLLSEPENTLKKNSMPYRRGELQVDQNAVSILKQIDHLDKKVRGTRGVYELLSEFAHPNTGIFLAFRHSSLHCSDRNGQSWEESNLSYASSRDIFEDMLGVFEETFRVVSRCVLLFEEILTNTMPEIENKIQLTCKCLTRKLFLDGTTVNNNHFKSTNSFFKYSRCPCGSGDRAKFCCMAELQKKYGD